MISGQARGRPGGKSAAARDAHLVAGEADPDANTRQPLRDEGRCPYHPAQPTATTRRRSRRPITSNPHRGESGRCSAASRSFDTTRARYSGNGRATCSTTTLAPPRRRLAGRHHAGLDLRAGTGTRDRLADQVLRPNRRRLQASLAHRHPDGLPVKGHHQRLMVGRHRRRCARRPP